MFNRLQIYSAVFGCRYDFSPLYRINVVLMLECCSYVGMIGYFGFDFNDSIVIHKLGSYYARIHKLHPFGALV